MLLVLIKKIFTLSKFQKQTTLHYKNKKKNTRIFEFLFGTNELLI
jgi:hypothetical protein